MYEFCLLCEKLNQNFYKYLLTKIYKAPAIRMVV